jgi:hypothetical protein
MPKSNQYRVSVPALNGGVNLNDAPNLVEDNQLTAVLNMWWKDQALRTRAGLATTVERSFHIQTSGMGDSLSCQVHPPVRVYRDGKPEDYVCCSCEFETSRANHVFHFYRFNESGSATHVSSLTFLDYEDGDPYATGMFMFAATPTEDGIGLYAVFNSGDIYSMNKNFELQKIEKSAFYAPLVVVNAVGVDDTGSPPVVSGTQFEGYNLLSGAFRTAFTTDGKAHEFKLPLDNLTMNNGESPAVEYTGTDGTVTRWESFSNTMFYAQASAEIGGETVTVKLYRRSGIIEFSTGVDTPYPLPGSISNNLIVTAWKTDPEATKKIANMQFATWFGGDRSGINGGTRLFVSGNPDHPNLVHWSDINNPLYFPENNYAYIGESSQKVTGFGKQTDILVIFKEHEIYSAEYVSGNTYTAQDVIDGKVVDVTANAAVFPITPINSGIGCDCPNTIQLCNNRLIWATSDGAVYGLMAANQASERNVRKLSAMIESRLKAEDRYLLKSALSCDVDGHYMLFVWNRVYLLDYMDGVFQYYATYSDERKAQRNMSWYCWEFPKECTPAAVMPKGDRLSAFCIRNYPYTDSSGMPKKALFGAAYLLDGERDCVFHPSGPAFETGEFDISVEEREIQSCFQTKVFDFGSQERKKKIHRLHMNMADTSNARITVSYVTEKGTMDDVYELSMSGTGAMVGRMLTPGVSRVCRFGVLVSSAGAIGVDGLVIRYEIGGEAI